MRHRIKKIPTLSKLNHKFNHHLLHSDKSTYTYFYKDKLGKVKDILYSPSIPLLGGAALLLVLGFSIFPNPSMASVYAESTPAEECNAGNTVLSLDMSGDMNLSTSVDNDISNGDISYLSKDFKVTACRTAGYKIYVQANSSKLQNQQAPDALLGVGENKAVADFTDNTWGYAVDEVSKDNTAMLYNTMPEPTTSRTESYSEDISTGASGKALKVTFAAKFGKDKVAGHYTIDVLMSVVANAYDTVATYTLSYDGNGNTGGTTPSTEIKEGGDAYTFTISGGEGLIKTYYGFDGWADNSNATEAKYRAGDTITLTKDAPSRVLYAVWRPFSGITTMQEMTTTLCGNASIGDTTRLIDTRTNADGKTRTYWVTKLADENCWMVENLDLDLKSGKSLTPTDSDVTSNWNPGQTTLTEKNLSISAWPMPADPYNPTTTEARIIRSYDSGDIASGNYYSWVAATAGTGGNISSGNASGSICPKGCRLPTGGDGGEFQALNDIYPKGHNWVSADNPAVNPGWDSTNKGTWFGGASGTSGGALFSASGQVDNGSLKSVDTLGYYWSSTASYLLAYYLYFSSREVNSSNSSHIYRGNSVRCVAR